MTSQSSIFLKSEGDEYYKRMLDSDKTHHYDQFFINIFSTIPQDFKPKKILEIGCADGHNLINLQKKFDCDFYGIDPSAKAIKDGQEKNANIHLSQGIAEELSFPDNFFDMIILGFCLYLCDRNKLFKIASEVDRVLKENSYLVIIDFYPGSFYYKNKYCHTKGIFSFKMDYAKMFIWNPQYSLVSAIPYSHHSFTFHTDVDERISAQLLYKAPLIGLIPEGYTK